MRTYLVFFASALAVTVTLVASDERCKSEPSGAEMKSSFSQFLSRMEAKTISEAQLDVFEKHSCKWSTTLSGNICGFTYSTTLPFDQLSILPPTGTVSGNFFLDEKGQLKFETVIG